ncbi:YheU family protein [Citrifermentans pelophilum]|uniref:YheU family protein n=1 Tax=Geoanaerobacter pelophilus TaxID=60036 RepID=UPI001FEAB025|nr:YheU family protein [Geoanaerobacter pelophilus]
MPGGWRGSAFGTYRPDVLQNLIAEFVTREWEELGNSCHTLDDKILQVRQQLHENKAKIVFDLKTNTCNIVPNKG